MAFIPNDVIFVQNFLYIIAGLLFVSALISTAYISGSLELFSPPIVFAAFVVIGVLMRSIHFTFSNGAGLFEGIESADDLIYGYMATGLALTSYCLGYIVVGRKVIKLNLPTMRVKSKVFLYVLIIYSTIALAYYYHMIGVFDNVLGKGPFVSRFYITNNEERSSLTFLTWGADILYVVFLFKLSVSEKYGKLKYRDYLFLVVPLFTAMVTTNRGDMILYIIGVMCVKYSLTKHKFPFLKFSLILVLIIGGLGAIRGQVQSSTIGVEAEKKSFISTTYEHLMTRPYHMAIDKTSLVVLKTIEKNLYLFGQSFVAIIYAPIPRVLWSEKPRVRVGPWVAKEIYERKNQSGVPPGLIGELFLNFAWPGVFIGMLLYGVTCRLVYNAHKLQSSISDNCRVFYAIFLVSFVIRLVGADFVGACSLFLREVIPFLTMVFLVNRDMTSRSVLPETVEYKT